MTLAKYGIQYAKWTNQQLRDFAEQRGITTRGLCRKSRKFLIPALRAQDRTTSIDFLALPPEVRNMVYGMLLTPTEGRNISLSRSHHVPSGKVVCHNAILFSCKQAYNEASEIFYHHAVIPLELRLRYALPVSGTGTYTWGVGMKANQKQIVHEGYKEYAENSWPAWLTKVRKAILRVEIQVAGIVDGGLGIKQSLERRMNYRLYELVYLLGKDRRLRQLHLNIVCHVPELVTRIEALLSPLCALRAQDKRVTLEPPIRSNVHLDFNKTIVSHASFFISVLS